MHGMLTWKTYHDMPSAAQQIDKFCCGRCQPDVWGTSLVQSKSWEGTQREAGNRVAITCVGHGPVAYILRGFPQGVH